MFLIALFLALIRCEEAADAPNGETQQQQQQTEQPVVQPVVNVPKSPEGNVFHFQSFGNEDWDKTWTVTKLANYTGEWKLAETATPQAYAGEKLIFMSKPLAYYGLSTKFNQPLVLTDKTLVLQYEIRLQDNLNCGGAYMKLFGKDNFSPEELCNETRYVIMFGPDKCGSTDKVHFIFRHKNPKSGVVEEKHMTGAPSIKTDKLNHLYTLIVRPDNSFEILIDAESVKQGNLLKDFEPSVNPPKEIDDPSDSKPADWVDEAQIDDMTAVKPDDWDEEQPEFVKDPSKTEPPEGWLVDEPKFITDPAAAKPEDWDDDIHGEWEAPTIPNPKCESAPGCGEYEAPLIKNELFKGKWVRPKIANPAYKGEWKPRQIPNPNYFEDEHPHNFPDVIGAGFELWMVDKDIGFGNVLVSTDEKAVHNWNKVHFLPKHKAQEETQKKTDAATKEEEEKSSKKATSGEGFTKALKDFGTTISDAYMNLYTENQALTIAITTVACVVPIILILVICCRGSTPAPAPTPSKSGKKADEKKKEEKKKVEVVEEEEEEKEEEKKKDVKEEKKAQKTKKNKTT